MEAFTREVAQCEKGTTELPPPQISHCVLLFPPEVFVLEGRPDLPLQVDQMAQLSM